VLIAVEDHGAGRQYLRFGFWPKCTGIGLAVIAFLASVAGTAATSAAWIAAVVFAGVAILVIARVGQEAGRALAVLEHAMAELAKIAESPST
jgi:O-antigen biosynthesis protein